MAEVGGKDLFKIVQGIVRQIYAERPWASLCEQDQLIAILCTSEGVLPVDEVFQRFERREPIMLRKSAWEIPRQLRKEAIFDDSLSDVNCAWRAGKKDEALELLRETT